ncbi:hypothetical protein CRX72_15745 [Pantoea sp. BRM17]|nr:hypothetical protein CRX72_15745 [Pantoea sp. BRM17]
MRNLVAKEYVAAQDPDDPGVLVLSRFAGAANELTSALIVNPYDRDEVAAALDKALTMSRTERITRYNDTSRGDVQAYQDIRHQLETEAGRINGKYGTLGWTPLYYLNQHFDRRLLMKIFRLTDVGLVTPLRDGIIKEMAEGPLPPKMAAMKRELGDAKNIIACERLDYSKGLPERFLAYEALLENFPQHRGKIRYSQIAPLPPHQELLEMLSDYDLLGFQTESDRVAFLDSLSQQTQLQNKGEKKHRAYGNTFMTEVYPIGIEPDAEAWEGYCRVNTALAHRLKPLIQSDDVLWIHDYHLLPFAAELRKLGVTNRIGFFLHIPFPTPEIFNAWFGWNGEISEYSGEEEEPLAKLEHDGITYASFPLNQNDYDQYYCQFSNTVIWPAFHYRLDLVQYQRAGHQRCLAVAGATIITIRA